VGPLLGTEKEEEDARLDKLWIGKDFVSVAKKSIVEIFTVGIFVNSVSIGARGVMVGHDTKKVISHVKEEMPAVTLNDARIWGPYNMIDSLWLHSFIHPSSYYLFYGGHVANLHQPSIECI